MTLFELLFIKVTLDRKRLATQIGGIKNPGINKLDGRHAFTVGS
jgi:hypothetical protein